MHIDGNFPAPLQVLAFLGSGTFVGVLGLVSLYGFARKKAWAGKTVVMLAGGASFYFLLLTGFSIFSHEQTLARGEEKYFCEIDCHLAYSIGDVKWIGEGAARKLVVPVRTQFDEKTISAGRPKDAPLTPNPRNVVLVDATGTSVAPLAYEGTPLTKELIPGQSYTTTFTFAATQALQGQRLLITSTGGPLALLIGNEMSWGHKKTYFEL